MKKQTQRGADTFQSSPSKAALVPWTPTHGTEDPAMILPLNTHGRVTTGRPQDFREKPHYLWAVYPTLSLAPDPRDFPDDSAGKESTCNAGDLGSIPGSGRSPGGRKGNPLQYSGLENPIVRGAWWAPVHGVEQSQTRLKRLSSSSSSSLGQRSRKQNLLFFKLAKCFLRSDHTHYERSQSTLLLNCKVVCESHARDFERLRQFVLL